MAMVVPPIPERPVNIGNIDAAADKVIWYQGSTSATVQVAPKLTRAVGWHRNDSGVPLLRVPEGSVEIPAGTPSAKNLASWASDLEKLRRGSVKVVASSAADLDSDGVNEGVVCIVGGKPEGMVEMPCYLVDQEGSERRYHALNINWRGDNAESPKVFSKGGLPYLMWVGPGSRRQSGKQLYGEL